MGCDIHIIYQRVSKEQKRENALSEFFNGDGMNSCHTTKWSVIDDADTFNDGYGNYQYQFSSENRNYYWFGRMSEVRGYGPRITTSGLPNDVNMDDYDVYIGDGSMYLGDHSFSHVYLDRLLSEEWNVEDTSRMSTFINEDIPRMVDYCKKHNLKPSEFRLLIGYDS